MSLEEITQLAERLARTYNPQSIAPFPHENVLTDCTDLDILFADLEDDDVSGVTLYKNERYTILINTVKPERLQHFTLGHELGHYFLHKDLLKKEKGIVDADTLMGGAGPLFRIYGSENTQLELEANNFAGSLLMPADLVRQAWQSTRNIEECADIFQVSAVAMSVRLTKLKLIK